MKRALAIAAVAVWLLAIFAIYRWSVSGSSTGWAIANAAIVGVFGLAALVPALRWLSRKAD